MRPVEAEHWVSLQPKRERRIVPLALPGWEIRLQLRNVRYETKKHWEATFYRNDEPAGHSAWAETPEAAVEAVREALRYAAFSGPAHARSELERRLRESAEIYAALGEEP